MVVTKCTWATTSTFSKNFLVHSPFKFFSFGQYSICKDVFISDMHRSHRRSKSRWFTTTNWRMVWSSRRKRSESDTNWTLVFSANFVFHYVTVWICFCFTVILVPDGVVFFRNKFICHYWERWPKSLSSPRGYLNTLVEKGVYRVDQGCQFDLFFLMFIVRACYFYWPVSHYFAKRFYGNLSSSIEYFVLEPTDSVDNLATIVAASTGAQHSALFKLRRVNAPETSF